MGLESFTNLQKLAADLDGNKKISSTDALLLRRRVVGLDDSFINGDWIFDTTNVIINKGDVIKDITGICVGDVNVINATQNPLVKHNKLFITHNKDIYGVQNEIINIPINIFTDREVAALTLYIHYPEDIIEILKISSPLDEIIYNTEKGRLVVVWDNLKPIKFDEGQTILMIRSKIVTSRVVSNTNLSVGDESEFANLELQIIGNVSLEIPTISTNIPLKYNLSNNFPNPFNPNTIIEYSIPQYSYVKLEIFNILGEKVETLIQGFMEPGVYKTSWNAAKLSSGIYLYKLRAESEEETFVNTKKMLLLK